MKGALQCETLTHGRVALALHRLKRDPGPELLVLHALQGSSADWHETARAWPGSVSALDFSGHGESDWLPGRGYCPEVYVAEADAALARIESASSLYLAGEGIGAYVALLLAGARADRVTASLLLPGAGFHGGGTLPAEVSDEAQRHWQDEISAPPRIPGDSSPDPLVQRCARDVRPDYYVEEFARAAGPLRIATVGEEPHWLAVARQHGRAEYAGADPRQALRALAQVGRRADPEPPGALL